MLTPDHPHDLVYCGGDLDRAAAFRREPAWLARALADPATRIVPVWRHRNLIRPGEAPQPVLLPVEQARELATWADESAILLGLKDGAAQFALALPPAEEPPVAGLGEFIDLRAVGAFLSRSDAALLAYARAITLWHSRHRFCPSCGSPTRPTEAGHVRTCTHAECGTQHFPRTDPAVIMLVTDGERALLGRQAAWPAGTYSTLAGFVEPGESLEEAVAREVLEETGVRVRRVHYRLSQPWPFPASLMLGFLAESEADDVRIDPTELEDARWFTRAEIRERAAQGGFLPRADSVARRLIEVWLNAAPR